MLGAPPSPRPPPRLAHRVARRPTSARSVVVHARPCAYWPLDGGAPRDGATTSLPPMVSAAVRRPGSARTPEHRSQGGSLTTATGDDRWQAELRQAWRIRAESTGRKPRSADHPFAPHPPLKLHATTRAVASPAAGANSIASSSHSDYSSLPHWHPLGSSQHVLQEVRSTLRQEYWLKARPHDRGGNAVKKRIETKILAMLAARRWQGLARRVRVWYGARQGAYDALGSETAEEAVERLEEMRYIGLLDDVA